MVNNAEIIARRRYLGKLHACPISVSNPAGTELEQPIPVQDRQAPASGQTVSTDKKLQI
jgi:hypothetical protein